MFDAFCFFSRMGQLVGLEKVGKFKRLEKLQILKENRRNQAIPAVSGGQ